MATFNVTWEMEVQADSFEDAAEMALAELRDMHSEATAFDVVKLATGESAMIDLPLAEPMVETLDLAPEVGC